jgi:UDP:flavonoid glycosyltransferase YjiC (YdhE family)
VGTSRPGRYLIVTWQAGGGVHPSIGIGRMLTARGAQVTVLGPGVYRSRIERAGCTWKPLPPEAEFDPSAGRAAEDQREYLSGTFLGPIFPAALMAEVTASEPDALVIDQFLVSTICAAQTLAIPVSAVVHTLHAFHGDRDTWGEWGFDTINEMRRGFGLPAIPAGSRTIFGELQRRCDRELVVMPAEFDLRPEAEPNVVHTGPIFEEQAAPGDWDLPWPPDDPVPLVVVSLSSQYMHHEEPMERILEALAELPVHVLALTGHELDPADVNKRPGVEVRQYVPHVTVLPHAAVVVTHAGTGTLMAGFAHGVPMVCIPLGRDQPRNAARSAELGVALSLPTDAGPEQIRAAVGEALGSPALRAASAEMASTVARYGGGERAVEELESLVPVVR